MTTSPKLPINLEALLHQRRVEGERIEYKKGWNPRAVLHSLCAFANDFQNLGGGYVILGVEEQDGRPRLPPAGLAPERLYGIQQELLNMGNAALVPHYHPQTAVYEVEGRHIMVLWAPGGGSRPYKARVSLGAKQSGWGFYIRKHASTVRAKGEDERELLTLTATVPFDDRYQQSAEIGDLAPHLIREFLAEVGSELAADAPDLSVEALGRRMDLVGGPAEALFPKNVGLLFFNEHPERFFPATQIDVVYFPDGPGGDHFEEREFRGPLGRITRDAVDYISRNFLKERVVKRPDRPEADRFWNFPAVAVEEVVVNAVYHRSYEIREPVEVRITPEELAVLSHPGPDRSISMADLRTGRAASRRYRNRRVGEFLKELDLTEGRSTGVPKILRAMRRNGSPEPVFETDEHRDTFLVRLPVRAGFGEGETAQAPNKYPTSTQQVAGQAPRQRPASDPQENPRIPRVTEQGAADRSVSAPQATQQVTQQVAQQVEAVLDCCVGEMGRGQLQQALGLTDRPHFATNYLAPALELGVIEMTQPDSPNSPTQKYRLTDKGRAWLAGGGE